MRLRMTRSKTALEGGRPRRPRRQWAIGLESLERRELLAATLDPTFGTAGLVTAAFGTTSTGTVNSNYGAAARQPDGKLVLVGSAIGAGGNSDFAITRLNADGSLDTTFGTAGVRIVPFDRGGGASGNNDDVASGVAIQPDGKIVVAGLASGNQIALARLLPNGEFDRTFE